MKQGHRTFVWVVALLASMFVYSLADAQPNMRHVVEQTAQRWPHVYALAHKDYGQQGHPGKATKAQAELFIRLAAWELHQIDARFALNGKRGNPHDLSQDVVLYRIAPNHNQGFDVIAGAGGPHPSIVWNAFPPSTDAEGAWVQPRHIPQAEIDAILAGGTPGPPPPPPTTSGIPLAEAAAQIVQAFDATHHRALMPLEIEAISAYARAKGWGGGARFPAALVAEIVQLVTRYSGDITNPFPTIPAADGMARIDARFEAKFSRPMQSAERAALTSEAARLGWSDLVPLWLVEYLEAAVDAYDGSLWVAPARPVDPLARPATAGAAFSVNDEPFAWRGITAFLLFYDYVHRPAQYQAFVSAAEAAKVTVPRISISTSTEYLTLTPRSGGTYGQGWTTPLYPGSVPHFWPRLRAMIADLNARGMVPEIVPFLTVGPLDASVPQMRTAQTRMAYLQEAARELLPMRATFVEIANEYNFIGFAHDGIEIAQLAAAYKAIDPDRLVALSAPPGTGDTPAARLMASGDYITVHADRSITPRSYTWVIRQLGLPQLGWGKAVINDEGINADTVGEFGIDHRPENHWANGVLMRLAPLAYTFHFDRALKGLAPATHDGSQQAIDAWRDGTDAVPAGVQGHYVAYPKVLGADVAVARLADTDGWLLLLGATITPALPEWAVTLIGTRGSHRLYRMTRIVH